MIARRSTFSLALASTALIAWGALADTRVGVTSAVNPSAAGAPPGADSRQLTVGSDIVFRERVVTTTDGQAQILFLDQSSLLIGPNSTVVIDEFVYDPATNKGNIAATLTQGSFRYIGGKLSKQGNATLKTPVATIGIRGSDITVNYESAKSLMNVIATHGLANIQALNGGTIGLRSGFGATIDGLNNRNGAPTALTAQQIAAANGQFEGQSGKNAGAGNPPTDGDVANSGLSNTVEAQGLASIAPAAGGPVPQGPVTSTPIFTPGPNDKPPATQQVQEGGNGQGGTGQPNAGGVVAGQRSALTLQGYVAGFGFPNSETSAYSHILSNESPNDVVIQTRPDTVGVGRVFATFAFRTIGASGPNSAAIEFGDPLANSAATKSVFLDNVTFMAFEDAASGKARIDGNDAAVSGAVMVSLPGSNLGNLQGPANGDLCTCEFVTWGLWTADLASSENRLAVLGLWVAGKLPNVNDPSPQGSATFSGAALGVVQNSGSQYFASGTFTNNYNFTQRTGTVNISNFDGKSFGGTVSAGADWRNYTGGLSGSGLTGGLNGSFYGNRNAAGQLQVPMETAGNFNVSNSGYAASGIFVGRR
jgi:hypothetical protein